MPGTASCSNHLSCTSEQKHTFVQKRIKPTTHFSKDIKVFDSTSANTSGKDMQDVLMGFTERKEKSDLKQHLSPCAYPWQLNTCSNQTQHVTAFPLAVSSV